MKTASIVLGIMGAVVGLSTDLFNLPNIGHAIAAAAFAGAGLACAFQIRK